MTRTIAGRKIKQLVISLAAAAAIAASALPAGAAGPSPEPGHYRETYQTVWASSYTCSTENGATTCNETDLSVYFGESGAPEVCLSIATYAPEDYEYSDFESGCAPIAPDAVAIGKKLSSATLSDAELTLVRYDCTSDYECTEVPSRTVTVSAQLSGSGELQSFRDKSRHDFGDGCTYTFSSKGESREQTGSINVAGAAFATTGAFIVSSTGAHRVTC